MVKYTNMWMKSLSVDIVTLRHRHTVCLVAFSLFYKVARSAADKKSRVCDRLWRIWKVNKGNEKESEEASRSVCMCEHWRKSWKIISGQTFPKFWTFWVYKTYLCQGNGTENGRAQEDVCLCHSLHMCTSVCVWTCTSERVNSLRCNLKAI